MRLLVGPRKLCSRGGLILNDNTKLGMWRTSFLSFNLIIHLYVDFLVGYVIWHFDFDLDPILSASSISSRYLKTRSS